MASTATPTPVAVRPRTFAEATDVLKAALPGYEDRPQQVSLATAIEASWNNDTTLVGQAGTGTGKSLASLIPAVLAEGRTIYSTATKALQEQVFGKDLPFLHEHLGGFEYAMLQGRSNYFCHLKAMENAGDNPLIADTLAVIGKDDEKVPPQGYPSISGLRDSIPVELDNKSWSYMTISADDCPRKKCPYYEVCRFQAAKRKADKSKIVVANHALVALDGVIHEKTEGAGGILPEYEHLVVDECHELEEYLTSALTGQFTPGTFKSLTGEMRAVARMLHDIEDAHEAEVERLSTDMIVQMEAFFNAYPIEDGEMSRRVRHREVMEKLAHAEPLLVSVIETETIFAEYNSEDYDRGVKGRLSKLQQRLGNLRGVLTHWLLDRDNDVIRVTSQERNGSTIFRKVEVIPVRVSEWARDNLWARVRPILISATCLVDGRPDYLVERLGIDNPTILDVGTPFDFDRQSRVFIPEQMTAPAGAARRQWEMELHSYIPELIRQSQGRALVLFTSRRQMEATYNAVHRMIEYPCRKQGDLPNNHLSRWFAEETNSVLFATKSFFTGIDIQGESLSLVIIDKLPFPVPTDPVVQARSEDIERRGGNSFSGYTIPVMTLVLQQAFGRLIRTKADKGVVAIMDSRLKTKGYGSKILRSLPGPKVTEIPSDFLSQL